MRKKNHQTWKNLSHASSSLTEKFQARQPVFSAFELLCERHIKGPLAIIKREWEEPIENDHSVLSYILDTRSKLNSMTD